MVKVGFLTLMISTPFAWAKKKPQIPNSGRVGQPGFSDKRGPTSHRMTLREGLQSLQHLHQQSTRLGVTRKRPMSVTNGFQPAKSRRKRPMTFHEGLANESARKKPKSLQRQLGHHTSENDVLSYDYIEEPVVPKVPTVPIPEEILALDEEEKATKTKSEGRRKRGRVVGGTDVLSEEEFPFFGTLRNSAQPNCGGTILGTSIHPDGSKKFLNSKHCIKTYDL